MRALAAILFLVLASCGSGNSAQCTKGQVAAGDGWSRAAKASQTGIAYLTIRNETGCPVILNRVTSDVAARASLHETSIDNGVSRMRPVNGLTIDANSEVNLEPGGMHIMLSGLTRPIEAEMHFNVTLEFDNRPPVVADIVVVQPEAH